MRHLFQGTDAKFYSSFVKILLASFNNRQGQDPECLKFLKLNLKFPYIIGFSQIPCSHRKHTFSHHVLAKTLSFTPHTVFLKMLMSASSPNTVYTESAQFYSAFLPNSNWFHLALLSKTQIFTLLFCRRCSIQSKKHTVAKSKLSFIAHVQQQHSVMLRAFGKNGSDWKCQISGQIRKRLSKVLAIPCLISLKG